jgi:hypothetical protein
MVWRVVTVLEYDSAWPKIVLARRGDMGNPLDRRWAIPSRSLLHMPRRKARQKSDVNLKVGAANAVRRS